MPAKRQRSSYHFSTLLDSLSMGRKKARKDPKAAVSSTAIGSVALDAPAAKSPQHSAHQEPSTQSAPSPATSANALNTDAASTRSSTGWYGSWKAKAPATTKVDGNSIVTPDRARLDSPQDDKEVPPTRKRYMSNMPNSPRPSSKSIPLAASTTKIHATSGHASDTRLQEDSGSEKKVEEPPLPPPPQESTQAKEAIDNDGGTEIKSVPQEPPKSAIYTWRGWWSKPDNPPAASIEQKAADDELHKDSEAAKEVPLPESPETTKKSDPIAVAGRVQISAPSADSASRDRKGNGAAASSLNRTSWFYFWSRQQNAQGDWGTTPPAAGEQEANEQSSRGSQNDPSQEPPAKEVTPASESAAPIDTKHPAKDAALKSSGWAFWSRDKPKSDCSSDSGSTHKQVGELAVADTPSQSHPEAAQFNEHEETPKKGTTKKAKNKSGRDRLKAEVGTGQSSTLPPSTPAQDTTSEIPKRKSTDAAAQTPVTAKGRNQSRGTAQLLSQTQGIAQVPHQKNIILPQFESTYHAAQMPSYWDQLRRMFWSSGQEPPRVHLETAAPRIHNALAIGVHGYFPAPMIRSVLGQPTGTSIRFANLAAASIKEWVKQHGDYECEIEKAALEGEGFIADRVDTLWKLLLNWIDKIRKADLILVAAHSQGVPVAIMLVAKLIRFGCVNPNARLGICAMAGVNMGPFIEYKTSWLGGTANELFDFSRPDSKVSLMYEDALDVVLGHGVRISYIGSIDDQLVSLESSTFTPITHPYIYRAVFVDSRLQQSPDFIASLVGFVLKLRNLGVPDHDLIRELSPALAGSLVSGDGHSRLYDDLNVYLLAVRCTLETSALAPGKNPPIERWRFTGVASKEKQERPGTAGSGAISASTTTASSNPYFLPWAMRGVLEEELVRKELGDECAELLALFENWKPQSKGLKDVRFRLEAVKSKL